MFKIKNRIISLFGIVETVKEIYDTRGKNAQIPTGAVFLSLFFGMLALCKSLKSMKRFRKMRKLFSSFGMKVKSFSEDTVSDVLGVMAIGPLKNSFIRIVKTLRKNKIFESAKHEGWLAVAIDLNQYGRLFQEPKDREEWHYTKASENAREYYSQKGVFAQVMNSIKPFFIGFMRCPPGKGELTIAKKLIPWLAKNYHGLIDIIVGDGLYSVRPIIEEVRKNGFHLIAWLKDKAGKNLTEEQKRNRSDLIRNVDGLAKLTEKCGVTTKIRKKRNNQVDIIVYQYWDIEHITWGNVKNIRVIKLVPKSINGMKPSKKQRKPVYILTTIPANQMSVEDIMFFQKNRWHIENCGFRVLNQSFGLKKLFCHNSNGLEARIWILLMVFNVYIWKKLFKLRRKGKKHKISFYEISLDFIKMINDFHCRGRPTVL